MTVEAAFAKLGYLLGKGYSGDKLRYLMETDIRGEVTERPAKMTGQASLASLWSRNESPISIPASTRARLTSNAADTKDAVPALLCESCHSSSLPEEFGATPATMASDGVTRMTSETLPGEGRPRGGTTSLGSDAASPDGTLCSSRVPRSQTCEDAVGARRVHIERQALLVSRKDEALERGPRTAVVPKELVGH